MAEAYVNGVSTRKVDRLVEQLGVQGMSKDRASLLVARPRGQWHSEGLLKVDPPSGEAVDGVGLGAVP